MSQLLGTVEGIGSNLASQGQGILDSVFPPERRAAVLDKIKGFVIKNPKLSAFLASNIALTAGPLILFALFSLTVLVFSLVVALVVGLLIAVLFTVGAVGVGLLVLFPTIFFTTLVACFVFLWGLGGYYLLKWFNHGETPAPEGKAIGDKLNSFTGGRLNFLMKDARYEVNAAKRKEYEDAQRAKAGGNENEKNESQPNGQANGQANGHANGTPKKPKKIDSSAGGGTPNKAQAGADGVKKGLDAGKDQAAKGVNGVQKNVGDTANKVTKTANVDGATNKVNNVTSGVKGIGSMSGLT